MGKTSGIYFIKNTKNKKIYIGQSEKLYKRERDHFYLLDRNIHTNKHLQNTYNKYGKDIFKFEILLYCEPFELTRYEQFFVDYFEEKNLYNICLRCVDSRKGVLHTEEAKNKMRKNHPDYSGKNNPNYGLGLFGEKNGMYGVSLFGEKNGMYGKTHTKESKNKMRKNACSRKLNEKDIFEILDLYYNKNYTQEEISKIFLIARSNVSYIVRGKHWENCYNVFTKE